MKQKIQLEKYTQKKTKIKLMPKVNFDPDFSVASSKKITSVVQLTKNIKK